MSTSSLVGVLDLLLTRAHKLVVVGMVVFFLGPTILVGFLVWRLVDREDKALTQGIATLNLHAAESAQIHTLMQTTLLNFMAAQRDIEQQRNALLFEMCLNIANDGPARARCRQAIGR